MAEPKKSEDKNNIDFVRIVELISKYEQIKKSGEIKRYNEESTKKDFIQPLFESLGWNFSNRGKSTDSVSAEETISKKRVDYGFRISGIPKFFVEAKSLKEENIQTNHKYITQAIDYAWMKSCSWAILTNFETIAVYNADWKESNYRNNLFFVLHPSDFLTDKRFTYLSKGALENNVLDNEASKYGKKQLKNPINKQLLQDMIHFREVLSKDIVKNNQDKHLTQDDIDESVQRILDRLIFIRNAEDRGLEENQLQSNVRQWYAKGKGHLVKEISGIYKDYDSKYNSKLFAHHLCDDLYIENEALQDVIEGLNHSNDNSYRYDFSIIESDVLGNIYEQYLGNILKSTPKRAKLEESKTHRKEQGIYYTPSYIVDYIVKNTLGEYIKTHTPEEIRNVRIVDPACGSGSFLIRAYKELENYWKQNSDFAQTTLDSEEFYSKKVEILKNNIFGVDLDPKAVEIAQLNLLLQISERKQKLPILQNNIKVGNSLIDDPSISDRAFKWEEEFPEKMKEGGFDIVIGNPPYLNIETIPQNQKNFLKRFECFAGKSDLLYYFYNKSISLLKKEGVLGFISSRYFLEATYARNLRKYILNNCVILKIIDLSSLPVFEEVGIHTVVLILKKMQNRNQGFTSKIRYKEVTSKVQLDFEDNNFIQITQSDLDEKGWILGSSNDMKILEIMNSRKTTTLGDISIIEQGQKTGFNEAFTVTENIIKYYKMENEFLRKLVKNSFIEPYFIADKGLYLIYASDELNPENSPHIISYLTQFKNELTSRAEARDGLYPWYRLQRPRSKELFDSKEKIIVPYRAHLNKFGYDDQQRYNDGGDVRIIVIRDPNYSTKYILALLNSKLMNYYYRFIGRRKGTMFEYFVEPLKKIPIIKADLNKEGKLIEFVDKIIFLKWSLNHERNRNTEKMERMAQDINKIESQIDEIVYEIYGLSKQDIKITEE